jgi:hypothetical protein
VPGDPEAVKKLNRDNAEPHRVATNSRKRARSARSTWMERALSRTLSAGSDQFSIFSQLPLRGNECAC